MGFTRGRGGGAGGSNNKRSFNKSFGKYGYEGKNEYKTEEDEPKTKMHREDDEFKVPTKSAVREKFEKAKMKEWRLIIRNLPFKIKKEDLQNICSNIGPFTEIVLPPSKKDPKRLAGFGFLQFVKKEDAEKAREYLNSNKILGRMVAADWALDKDTYETNAHEEKQHLKKVVKTEKPEKTNVKKFDVDEDDEDDDSNDKNETIVVDDEEEGEEEDDADDEQEDEEDEGSEASDDEENKSSDKTDKNVVEGKVVFIRNLSFETTSDKLKEELARFGNIELAIICKYKDSGHPKGTAFVHFSTPLEASKCIEGVDEGIIIDDRLIKASLAIPKNDAAALEKEKLTKVPKDKRNLRLVRFSLIRDGTSAAKGMSKEDAEKRKTLAESMKKKLENTNMFVSPVRLCIHNLPQRINDAKLKEIIQKSTSKEAVLTECRVWMNKKKLTTDGKPMSAGFGFVAFKEHVHALECLKKLNNNAETFGNDRRPIVEFSIENIMALQAKERRKIKVSEEKMSERQMNEKIKQQIKNSIGEVHTAGMKFLPKFLGKKIRHRNMTGKAKKNLEAKNKSKALKYSKITEALAQGKKIKKKSKQDVTKYLSLSK